MRSIAVAMSFLLSGGALQAAVFDLSSGELRQATVESMTVDGIGLTISGAEGTSGATAFDIALGGDRGLGVVGTGDNAALGSQVESWGLSTEAVHFAFDRTVRVEAISFAWVDGQDRATLISDGLERTFKLEDGAGRSDISRIVFDDFVGTRFALTPKTWELCLWFGGEERCGDQVSGFRVTSLEVTAVVPLPLTGALLLTSLGGLAIMARRWPTTST